MKRLLSYQMLAFITYGKTYKSSYNNNKFKMSAPTWNYIFELSDRLYSVSDIQDYFEYIFKKYGENTDKPSIKLKTGLHLKLKMGIALNF